MSTAIASVALQAAYEEGQRGDWAAYALGHPAGRRAFEMRPVVAALLAEAELPELALRAELLAIDAEPQVAALAVLADELEERGEDPAEALVELFARKELLVRQVRRDGYAQLALVADGVSLALAEAELAEAEAIARCDAAAAAPGVADLPDAMDVWSRFQAFFLPLLDGVELCFDRDARVWGMGVVMHWPDRLGIVVRRPSGDASPAAHVATLGIMAHEAGHALQCRARAERGLGFLDFFALDAVQAETAADLAERLLFESELGEGMSLPRVLWSSERAADVLRHVRRARFELQAYAAALDAPSSLRMDAGWSRDGHGFYTEDPMRRYAYPLAYVRSKRLLASLEPPLTPEAVTRVI
jgi:hypothetical protein